MGKNQNPFHPLGASDKVIHFCLCRASGQRVSLSKSRLLVSSNISSPQAHMLSNTTKMSLTKDFEKYFGTPMLHGRTTKETYSGLISRIKQRLEIWSNRKLSMAGRITLVQSITSTMASYLMQTSFLPEATIKALDSLNQNLGHMGNTRKIHAIN